MISTLKSKLNWKTAKKVAYEVVTIAVIVLLFQLWRAKDMLDTDGSVVVDPVTTVSLQGEPITLFDKPQKTLIYFFAPWCRVCSWSIGSLEGIDDAKMNIVVIAMDYETVEEVEQFVQDHNVNVQVALGNRAVGQQFSIKGYPSYYLLNDDNQVVAKHFGYTTSTQIKLQDWLTM